MHKIHSLLLLEFLLLASCTVLPASITPTTASSAVIPTETSIPTVTSDNVEDLIQILYASDPELPKFNPQSLQYAQFADALQKLEAMGPQAIDAASHVAKAISFPRQETILAARTLLSFGPEITATTATVLMDNLNSTQAKSRLYSLILLGTIGERASCAVGNIGPLLNDTDPEVRFASAAALVKITGKDLLPKGVVVTSADPLSAEAILSDTPDGIYVQNARIWWEEEGSKKNWHPSYGLCDP